MTFQLSHLPEVQTAMDAAERACSIHALNEAIHAFDAHPLCRTPAMPGRPGSRMTSSRPIMILGKSPAGTESETRVPFSGPAGIVLREEMASAGFDLDACWISCATPWRAPKNNPNATQLAISRPFLHREIELVDPELIVVLGQKADEALFQRREALGDRPGSFEKVEIGGKRRNALIMVCHAYVMYGRAERAPAFRSNLIAAAARHPEAFEAIRIHKDAKMAA